MEEKWDALPEHGRLQPFGSSSDKLLKREGTFDYGYDVSDMTLIRVVSEQVGVALTFQIQDRRVGKGVDGIDLDNVFLHRENPTATQSDQIGPHRRSRRKDAGQRICGIPSRMNLEFRAQARVVIAVEPPEHPNFGELRHSHQTRLILLVQNDFSFGLCFSYPANWAKGEIHRRQHDLEDLIPELRHDRSLRDLVVQAIFMRVRLFKLS